MIKPISSTASITGSQDVSRATRFEMFWLGALIVSFCYERPLIVLSQYDRLNPRLFDVVALLGLSTLFPYLLRSEPIPAFLRSWFTIVAVFVACALLWTLAFLPPQYGELSLYFAARYVLQCLVILIAARIALADDQKLRLGFCVVFSGIFVALYSLTQIGAEAVTITLTGDKEIVLPAGTITGPLGPSYLHIGYLSPLLCLICFSTAFACRDRALSATLQCAAVFAAWPALASGSRAGLFLILFCTAYFLISVRRTRPLLIGLGVIIVVLLADAVTGGHVVSAIEERSFTLRRIHDPGNAVDANTVWSRFLLFLDFDMSRYKYGLLMPLFGAGFYVTPTLEGALETYRVGYGVHNSYLFALEQGGIVAMVLFGIYLVRVWRALKAAREAPHSFDSLLAHAVTAYFIGALIVGTTGTIFWMSAGTENFAAALLFIFVLATKRTASLPQWQRGTR